MVVETLSQADEYLSPEIEACLNNAGEGSGGRRGRAAEGVGGRWGPPLPDATARTHTNRGLARREWQKREQRPIAPPAGRQRAAWCRGQQQPCNARISAGAAGAGAGAARRPGGRWLCRRARRTAWQLRENCSRKQQRDSPARRSAAAEPPTPQPTCPAAAPASTPAAAGNPAPNQDGTELGAQVRRRQAGPASHLMTALTAAVWQP